MDIIVLLSYLALFLLMLSIVCVCKELLNFMISWFTDVNLSLNKLRGWLLAMKDISERIVSLGDKFMGFNITSGYIYALINLPKKWSIPSEIDDYNVKSVADNKSTGTYFFTEIVNGVDKVFDAIDHCVGVNKDAMERAQIFQEKIAELKEIFGDGTKTIEELRTLEFNFPPQKKGVKRPKAPVEKVVDKEIKDKE